MNKECRILTLALLGGVLGMSSAHANDLEELRDYPVSKDEWRMSKYDKTREIKVYIKNEEGKRIRSFKVEAVFNNPIEDLARLQADVDSYSKWYFLTMESRLLKKVSDKEFIFYMVHEAPLTMPRRDVIMRAVIEPMSRTHPFVYIRMTSIPDYLPPKPPYVRMESEDYTIKFTPLGKNKTLLESEGFINPGGVSPTWAINFLQGKGPYSNMIGMMRMLQLPKYKDAEQSEPIPFKFFE